ncbi:hypothetical protein [Moorena sp. SIO3A2]|uniref:hypothetical protein n=1 Tax=Moorena sp. SIO3A2 TaxID=2607841 RepID=UPI0013B96C9B|nr:hypothetical protein [Moorena sp. SIO3A2]NER90388.1 hypothetical protein [Moorena sp. SIO3A2]
MKVIIKYDNGGSKELRPLPLEIVHGERHTDYRSHWLNIKPGDVLHIGSLAFSEDELATGEQDFLTKADGYKVTNVWFDHSCRVSKTPSGTLSFDSMGVTMYVSLDPADAASSGAASGSVSISGAVEVSKISSPVTVAKITDAVDVGTVTTVTGVTKVDEVAKITDAVDVGTVTTVTGVTKVDEVAKVTDPVTAVQDTAASLKVTTIAGS